MIGGKSARPPKWISTYTEDQVDAIKRMYETDIARLQGENAIMLAFVRTLYKSRKNITAERIAELYNDCIKVNKRNL